MIAYGVRLWVLRRLAILWEHLGLGNVGGVVDMAFNGVGVVSIRSLFKSETCIMSV